MAQINDKYVIGIDVGTGSVRAGIFDLTGRMISYSHHDIKIWHPKENFEEHLSENIYKTVFLFRVIYFCEIFHVYNN